MDKKFDLAVRAVEDHLEKNQYSYGTTKGHSRCYQLLEEWLTSKNEMYSRHSAEEWIQNIECGTCGSTVKTYRQALRKLDEAYHLKEIINMKARYEVLWQDKCLAPWCKAVLDAFLEETGDAYDRFYLRRIQIAAAGFLEYLTERGGCGLEDVSHRLVANYCRDDETDNRKFKDVCNSHVRKFLNYLSQKGLIISSIPLALNKSVLSRLFFIAELSDSDRFVFCHDGNAHCLNAKEFRRKSLEFNALIDRHRYANTARNVFRKALEELYVFLEANSLAYSADAAVAWATHMRRYTVQWQSFRRAVMLFEQFMVSGRIDPGKVYRYLPDRVAALPTWCKADYEVYIGLRKKEGWAKSTLDMCKNSFLRLAEYLCTIGIGSWGQVTPEILKEFHRQESHSTPESKNAYSSKIRQFLEYLGDIGRVPPTMFLAVPSESAGRVTLVKTLDDADIENIYRYRDGANSALELRDAAMILIGLRIGIRASDIVKLRFEDISWDRKTISFQQKKTGMFLKVPMPVEVGNAIYRYITQGRPGTDSEFVFVNHKVPYDRLSRSVCRNALLRALPNRSCGFHDTRRTFASRMLINDVAAGRIAEALGHADNSSVMVYLSTDGDKMRLCALSLDGIPVKGGLLS